MDGKITNFFVYMQKILYLCGRIFNINLIRNEKTFFVLS